MSRRAQVARWKADLGASPTEADHQTAATTFTLYEAGMTQRELDETEEERAWEARDRRLAAEEKRLFPRRRPAAPPACRPTHVVPRPGLARPRAARRRRIGGQGSRARPADDPGEPAPPHPPRPDGPRAGDNVPVELSRAQLEALLAVADAVRRALRSADADDLVGRVVDIVRERPGATGRAVRAAAGGSHERFHQTRSS